MTGLVEGALPALNPVLVNDMRKSVFRRKPVLGVAYTAAGILILTLGVAQFGGFSGASSLRSSSLSRIPDLIMPIIAPVFASSSFAKEHEQRTWQDVLLTRLRSGEIIWGKFLSSLVPTLVTLAVLFPPVALMLIITGVSWAINSEAWAVVLGTKFTISAVCYVAIALVCSYHSPNARVALAVSYGCLLAYGVLNYALWQIVVPYLLNAGYWLGYGAYDQYQPWVPPSERTFQLAPVDQLALIQCVLLGAALLTYLTLRVRWRME